MFCPRCGSTQSDDLKFCKSCGTDLLPVRQVLSGKALTRKKQRPEMLPTEEERQQKQEERARQQILNPLWRRYNEIKAGVITSCVGLGAAIVISMIMEGVIRSGNVGSGTAEILARLWVAGVIPFFVGLALIFNGLVVSARLVEIAKRKSTDPLIDSNKQLSLPSSETVEFTNYGGSVTEGTTQHLIDPKDHPRVE